MAIQLNEAIYKRACALINQGRIEPDAVRLINDKPLLTSEALYLGIDNTKPPDDPGGGVYPIGDNDNLFFAALAIAKREATERGDTAIAIAADRLMFLITTIGDDCE
jgi:hypothetical protein